MKAGLEFLPIMVVMILGVSFFMGMLVHSPLVYKDKKNLKRDSKKAWVLSMTAGTLITGWMFIYVYYTNLF